MKIKQKLPTIMISLVLLQTIMSVPVCAVVTNEAFDRALRSATVPANRLSSTEMNIKNFKGIVGVEDLGAGKWKVEVQGARVINASQAEILTSFGIFENQGDKLTYVIQLPKISWEIYDDMMADGYVKKMLDKFRKAVPELQFSRQGEEEIPVVNITLGIADASGGQLGKILEDILVYSRALMFGIPMMNDELGVKYLKRLRSEKVKKLSRSDVENLVEGLSDKFKGTEDVKGGRWAMIKESQNLFFTADNLEDEFQIWMTRSFKELSSEDRAKRVEILEMHMKKNRFKKGSSAQALLYPGNEDFVAAKFTFKKDESMTGKDFTKWFEELRYEYFKEVAGGLDKK